MFFPYQQMPDTFWNSPRDLTVRTTGDPLTVAAAVRQGGLVGRSQPTGIAYQDDG